MTLTAGALAAGTGSPARADTAPPTGTPATVSADVLPTVQINGVVWSQVTVGNTVYATGSFSRARPAGAAAGTNETARGNLLAYNITTGALITSFNHTLNAQGRMITASPDGTRVYVGGDFTSVDGQSRNRVAAFDTATGALVAAFRPSLNGNVRGLTATNSTVFMTGSFTTAGGLARSRAAAAAASNGAVQPWAPVLNAYGTAMVLAPDASRVIIGGSFDTLNGEQRIGIGAVNTTTGASVAWNESFPIRDGSSDASYTSLVADGTNIYGTAYQYGFGGNFEGRFAADPYTGNIVWLNSCHGDSYGAWPIGPVLYSVGHAHDCSDAEDYSQDDNDVFESSHFYAMAESTAPVGIQRGVVYTGGPGIPGPRYSSFVGQPHSAQLNWYPTFTSGSYTGQTQAAWSITGNANYVSVGGEFPTANGSAQQGLSRYAVRAIAPNRIGPTALAALTPVAVSQTPGTARVSWRTTSDRDNVTLTYRLFRDGGSTPIHTVTTDTRFWYRPALRFVDTGLATGSSHTYRVTATDPLGNVRTSGTSAAVTITNSGLSAYATRVRADGAANFWPLSENSGTAARDYAGGNDLIVGPGVTRGAAGPAAAGTATASSFDGTEESITTSTANGERYRVFSVEAWVRTTSTAGGQIIGYGLNPTQSSVNTDRTLYLSTTGQVYFGVWAANAKNTVNSTDAINDGAWHHVVGTVSAADGMQLYVDGAPVASRPGTVSESVLSGYWRVGGDAVQGWRPSAAPPFALNGSIADVAVYPAALSATQVQSHYRAPVVGPEPDPEPEPEIAYGTDTFQRTATGGWGSADSGGAWSRSGGAAANFAVSPGAGTITLGTPGASSGSLSLPEVSARDLELGLTFSADKPATGGGAYLYAVSRRVSNTTQYRAAARLTSTGTVAVSLSKLDGSSTEVSLGSATVPGLTYAPGTALRMRFLTTGTDPTTLQVKVWADGSSEPAAWALSATDSSPALQAFGAVGLSGYLSGSSTNAPFTVLVSGFRGTVPQ